VSDFPDLILEIGVNHDNNLENAKELIRSASRSGAKTVKFQTYTAEKIAAKYSPSYWDLSEEPTESQIELFKKYDSFTVSDYAELYALCQELNLEFMTTCFDETWVDLLDKYLTRYKIASADITNFQLLTFIAKKQKPIILSTGASSMEEIASAIGVIRKVSNLPITLLHCVLNYPTSGTNANLGSIRTLKEKFPGFEIGYSDHTKPADSDITLLIARTLGAVTFEKHFTLDKSAKGNDHYHAYDESDVGNILERIKLIDKMISYSEESFLDIQSGARAYARRGLYAAEDLAKGTTLTNENIISLRPIPDGGFSADLVQDLIGKKLLQDLSEGDPIKHGDI